MKILVAYNIPRAPFSNLPKEWDIVFPDGDKEFFTKKELIELIPEFDVLLSFFTQNIDKDIIDAGNKLKLISIFGVGFNNVDIEYARKKNITVCNTPQSVCNPTAEHAMALMLSVARRIGECNIKIRLEKEAIWGAMRNLGYTLENKTLGIIGMGRIGKRVAEMAKAFSMNIIYTNRTSDVDGYKKVSLDDLLKKSDFISIHTPLNKETRHLIGKREIIMMKPTAIVINTARGELIDEKALADALEKGKISGAGLDVFESEPSINPKLYTLSNVVLTPHIGSGTVQSRIETGKEALTNIINFVMKRASNVVN